MEVGSFVGKVLGYSVGWIGYGSISRSGVFLFVCRFDGRFESGLVVGALLSAGVFLFDCLLV